MAAKRTSPALIGAFVVGAVALAVAAVVVLGSGRFFRHTREYVSFFDGSLNGLRVGAPVKFRGVEVGTVRRILLRLDEGGLPPAEIRLPVIFELDFDAIEAGGGRIRPENIPEAIEQGLRARLATESFVTGILYVALDYRPDTPINLFLPPDSARQEVPTVPTAMEEMESTARQVIAKVAEIDVKGLVESARATLDAIREVAESPGLRAGADELGGTMERIDAAVASLEELADATRAEVGPLGQSLRQASDRAAVALEQATDTLKGIDTALAPDSAIVYDARRALNELVWAARAVREFADYLERNPGALVRGKRTSGDAE
jgi:paraquat-inducible protein B